MFDTRSGMEKIRIRDFYPRSATRIMMFSGWSKLCLLLDYDGTLAPHGKHPDLTILPTDTQQVSFPIQQVNLSSQQKLCNHLQQSIVGKFSHPAGQSFLLTDSKSNAISCTPPH
jgi:hypothetical protein